VRKHYETFIIDDRHADSLYCVSSFAKIGYSACRMLACRARTGSSCFIDPPVLSGLSVFCICTSLFPVMQHRQNATVVVKITRKYCTDMGEIAQSVLRAGRSGDRIPVGTRFSAPVQTGPGAQPSSFLRVFLRGYSCRGVSSTTHSLLV
jgi:hypothetical protein